MIVGPLNALLVQPFINYNFPDGWYLTSSPIITANWLVASDDRWTLPIGGGVGKLFKLGKLPVNTQLAAYCNVVKPKQGGMVLKASLRWLNTRRTATDFMTWRAMSGSWCSDWYRADTYRLLADSGALIRNPKGPSSSDEPDEPGTPKRVQRGGSFLCSDQYCARYMVGTRGKGEPDSGSNHIGFRCVKTP